MKFEISEGGFEEEGAGEALSADEEVPGFGEFAGDGFKAVEAGIDGELEAVFAVDGDVAGEIEEEIAGFDFGMLAEGGFSGDLMDQADDGKGLDGVDGAEARASYGIGGAAGVHDPGKGDRSAGVRELGGETATETVGGGFHGGRWTVRRCDGGTVGRGDGSGGEVMVVEVGEAGGAVADDGREEFEAIGGVAEHRGAVPEEIKLGGGGSAAEGQDAIAQDALGSGPIVAAITAGEIGEDLEGAEFAGGAAGVGVVAGLDLGEGAAGGVGEGWIVDDGEGGEG